MYDRTASKKRDFNRRTDPVRLRGMAEVLLAIQGLIANCKIGLNSDECAASSGVARAARNRADKYVY
jgi:hypothetical protein